MAPRFADVKEGDSIPELSKQATTQDLVKFAGATGDFYQIHYDREFAEKTGLPDVILHGFLKKAYLARQAACHDAQGVFSVGRQYVQFQT